MPYEFKFLNDDPHISLVTFSGKVTQAELEAESMQAIEALNRCSSMYYTVADLTQKPTFMANILKMGKVMDVVRHKQFGWAILVGVNPLAGFWAELLERGLGLKYKAFPNLEDGLAFVESMRKLEKEQTGTYRAVSTEST